MLSRNLRLNALDIKVPTSPFDPFFLPTSLPPVPLSALVAILSFPRGFRSIRHRGRPGHIPHALHIFSYCSLSTSEVTLINSTYLPFYLFKTFLPLRLFIYQ